MPARIERMPNEPIVIVTFDGHLDVETVRNVFVETAAVFANVEGHVYRIADIRTAKIGFVDLINIVKAVRGGLPASSIDPRVHGVFVGQNQFARMYADLIKQLGGTPIPIFATMEDALDYAHLQLENGK